MKVETIEVSGLASALTALRLPYNKGTNSDIDTSADCWCDDWQYDNGETERTKLLGMRSNILVCPDDIRLLQKLIKTGDSHAKPMRGIVAYAKIVAPIDLWVEIETYRAGHERLFSASTMNTEGKKLHGKALRKVLNEVSFGREICKIDFFSYQCLRNIIYQRYNHRKLEWHIFLEWIATLPLADELILVGLEEQWATHKRLYAEYLAEED